MLLCISCVVKVMKLAIISIHLWIMYLRHLLSQTALINATDHIQDVIASSHWILISHHFYALMAVKLNSNNDLEVFWSNKITKKKLPFDLKDRFENLSYSVLLINYKDWLNCSRLEIAYFNHNHPLDNIWAYKDGI